ncbi:MAG: hypothetical protein CMP23_03655 [Rickettsiales bacterium]|nr:hypothetical protein [Rickettsiales bacterium]|tara:strand:- start:795 stop:1199 length:405 start_codon:yes stop_codon:yes gene_type:complete
MLDAPSSTHTRREVLRCLMVDGGQSAKILVDQSLLGSQAEHGFPASVLSSYPDGVPLDLNPRWPMDLDLDSDPNAFLVSFSFRGKSHRCRIPWVAVRVIGVGFGGIHWEHDPKVKEESADLEPQEGRGHLRIVK